MVEPSPEGLQPLTELGEQPEEDLGEPGGVVPKEVPQAEVRKDRHDPASELLDFLLFGEETSNPEGKLVGGGQDGLKDVLPQDPHDEGLPDPGDGFAPQPGPEFGKDTGAAAAFACSLLGKGGKQNDGGKDERNDAVGHDEILLKIPFW